MITRKVLWFVLMSICCVHTHTFAGLSWFLNVSCWMNVVWWYWIYFQTLGCMLVFWMKRSLAAFFQHNIHAKQSDLFSSKENKFDINWLYLRICLCFPSQYMWIFVNIISLGIIYHQKYFPYLEIDKEWDFPTRKSVTRR